MRYPFRASPKETAADHFISLIRLKKPPTYPGHLGYQHTQGILVRWVRPCRTFVL